ncbi:unnamed protein product [Orchesella dallaii]|uniref:Molybdopterin synthase sulfur carrier subunit n=1 Tax=Orchesella dallaii TaxID=48710 RepID=A0ABP1QZH7_9HEXA
MDHIISVKILFFAQAREQTGQSEGSITIPQNVINAREILNNILDTYPKLRPLEHCVILTVNHVYMDLTSNVPVSLAENDEIGVIPPISSG